jgi:hypothetical protein
MTKQKDAHKTKTPELFQKDRGSRLYSPPTIHRLPPVATGTARIGKTYSSDGGGLGGYS